MMEERSWLVPSLLLTVTSGALALFIMPNHSGVLPALELLPLWLLGSVVLGSIAGFFGMMAAGVKSPTRYMANMLLDRWKWLLMIAVGITVAGLNMIAFMWTKPLLNWFVPFWADPALARIDRMIFLGHDPWTLFGWLNSSASAIFYHRGWFGMMIMTLVIVLSRPPSSQKSAVMLTYFLLWSVVGPVIHILLPAAGPVFFERLGYGPEFNGIAVPSEMTEVSDYLWQVYQGHNFGPGSGISAMPSLHIATTVWMIVAMFALCRRMAAPTAGFGIVIFLLSISLGWHYAIDGIVGGAAALGCHALCLRMYDGRMKLPSWLRASLVQPAAADAAAE